MPPEPRVSSKTILQSVITVSIKKTLLYLIQFVSHRCRHIYMLSKSSCKSFLLGGIVMSKTSWQKHSAWFIKLLHPHCHDQIHVWCNCMLLTLTRYIIVNLIYLIPIKLHAWCIKLWEPTVYSLLTQLSHWWINCIHYKIHIINVDEAVIIQFQLKLYTAHLKHMESLQSLEAWPTWLLWSSYRWMATPSSHEMMIIVDHDNNTYVEWHKEAPIKACYWGE